MPSVKYVCIRDGCWNQTSEVLCPKHRREADQKPVLPVHNNEEPK